MKKILAKELKMIFVETLNNTKGFKYGESNPFTMQLGSKPYFIFLKNISPAYFVNSPDITRVQLPYSKHFSKVLKDRIPFLILGYDADNDIFVAWNPNQVKDRLNTKNNVSLYSRKSIQSKVKNDELKEAYLSNGDKIVLLKRTAIIALFENLNSLFGKSRKSLSVEIVEEPELLYEDGKLAEIDDKQVLLLLKPLLKEGKVLEAVNVCIKHYGNQYRNMTFKDWFQIVNHVYRRMAT